MGLRKNTAESWVTHSDSQNECQPASDSAPMPLEPWDLDGSLPCLATAMRLTVLPSLLVVYAPCPSMVLSEGCVTKTRVSLGCSLLETEGRLLRNVKEGTDGGNYPSILAQLRNF